MSLSISRAATTGAAPSILFEMNWKKLIFEYRLTTRIRNTVPGIDILVPGTSTWPGTGIANIKKVAKSIPWNITWVFKKKYKIKKKKISIKVYFP